MSADEPTASSRVASFLDSETFFIKVGKDGDVLRVHHSLFTKSESPALQAVVSGKYKEGKGENGLDWTSEEVDTVKRMLAFLYTGDYNVPLPKTIKISAGAKDKAKATKENKSKASVAEDRSVDWDGWDATDTIAEEGGTQGGISRPLTPLQHHLEDVRLPTWRVNTEAGNIEYMEKNGRVFEWAPLLLAHAKVYVLADYHQLNSLMRLALQRLTQVMLYMADTTVNFQSELVQLIDYTYNQGLTRPEDLRKLVAQFTALHFHELGGAEWEGVVEHGGLFMRELCTRLGRRLLNQEIQLGGARARIAHRAAARNKNSSSNSSNAS
ncbi:hypothetical protein ABW21_db0203919 [Orbilia brochopaga]|nr:hypothetical protein ABW21_db0203919 [Drechslerella brochopaga]